MVRCKPKESFTWKILSIVLLEGTPAEVKLECNSKIESVMQSS